MVEGTVKEEDKQGNDKADEVAERGSRKEQENLATVAGLYSRRNKNTNNSLDKFRFFLLQTNKEETAIRERKRKEEKTLDPDERPKV